MSTPIAVHRPGADPAAPKPGAGGGMSALKKKPGLLLAAGGAGLVVILALMRSSSGSATDPTTGTTVQPGGSSTFDSTSNDLYNSIQPEIDALAKMIQDLQNKQPTPTGGTTPPGPKPPVPGKPVPPKPTPKPTPKPKPKPATKTYTIKRGDTLSGIASKLHVSMTTIKKLNPTFYTNPKYKGGNTIFAGGKVKY